MSTKTTHRIGIDCRMFGHAFTGIGRYVYELVERLQQTDHINEYYLFLNPKAFKAYQPKSPNFHKVLAPAKHYSFAEQFFYPRLLNSYNLDIMHFTHFNAPIFYRRPLIVTIHDLTLHFFPGRKLTSIFHRLAYRLTIRSITRKAAKIIAVSEHTAKDLQRVMRVPSEKVTVILEGVSDDFKTLADQDAIQATLKKFDISKPFLLYTGVWRDHKNLHGLIRAFKLIREKYNMDIQLVITGKKDNIYASSVFHEAGDYTENKHIVFTDHVSDVELVQLLNAAKVYVFPSFYEGFGLPPLEAMKCGTPVAVSNTSSMPEACGDAATYFDPYNAAHMASQIVELINSPVHYEFMSEKGLEQVKRFDWNSMTLAIFNLYNEVLKQQDGRRSKH